MGFKLETDSNYLFVRYYIHGIYGEVTYEAYYNIKNNEVEGIDEITDLIKGKRVHMTERDSTIIPFEPKFNVEVRDRNEIGIAEKYDIIGLPYGLTMDDYFRMAQLQKQTKASAFTFDGLKLELNKDVVEDLKNELVKLLGEITKEKDNNIGEVLKSLNV
jgi:hypothetical protein